MATLTVANLISQARQILQDVDAVRWSDAEFLGWMSSAYREILKDKPEANSVHVVFSCAAGTMQSLPADTASLISVIRNESATMKAIRPIERAVMDAQKPTWHTDPSTGDIDYYVYESQSPKVFYVYPQATGGQAIAVQYSQVPPAHVQTTEVIAIDDIYAGLLLDYLLYRAYSKDALAGDAGIADTYRDLFYTNLGRKPLYPARAITTV